MEAAACLSWQSGGKEVVLRWLYEEGCSPVHGAHSPGTGGLHTHNTAHCVLSPYTGSLHTSPLCSQSMNRWPTHSQYSHCVLSPWTGSLDTHTAQPTVFSVYGQAAYTLTVQPLCFQSMDRRLTHSHSPLCYQIMDRCLTHSPSPLHCLLSPWTGSLHTHTAQPTVFSAHGQVAREEGCISQWQLFALRQTLERL